MGEIHGDESHGRICKKAPTKQTQSYQSYGQFNGPGDLGKTALFWSLFVWGIYNRPMVPMRYECVMALVT